MHRQYEELYNEIEKAVAAGVMTSNPYKDKGFVPGDYSEENYDKIDIHRPYVDDIILVSDSGKPMKRELDLIGNPLLSPRKPIRQRLGVAVLQTVEAVYAAGVIYLVIL